MVNCLQSTIRTFQPLVYYKNISSSGKDLKEIHNNHYELYEYNMHSSSTRTAADRNSIVNSTFCNHLEETDFSLFRRISTNATVEFSNFFKPMNFSELFEIVALGLLSYRVVRIKNRMIILLSYFLVC